MTILPFCFFLSPCFSSLLVLLLDHLEYLHHLLFHFQVLTNTVVCVIIDWRNCFFIYMSVLGYLPLFLMFMDYILDATYLLLCLLRILFYSGLTVGVIRASSLVFCVLWMLFIYIGDLFMFIFSILRNILTHLCSWSIFCLSGDWIFPPLLHWLFYILSFGYHVSAIFTLQFWTKDSISGFLAFVQISKKFCFDV